MKKVLTAIVISMFLFVLNAQAFHLYRAFPNIIFTTTNSQTQAAGYEGAGSSKQAVFFDPYQGLKHYSGQQPSQVSSMNELGICAGQAGEVAFWWNPQTGQSGEIVIPNAKSSVANCINLQGLVGGEAVMGRYTVGWTYNINSQELRLLPPLAGDSNASVKAITYAGIALGESWSGTYYIKEKAVVKWLDGVAIPMDSPDKKNTISNNGVSDASPPMVVGSSSRFFTERPIAWDTQTGQATPLAMASGFISAKAIAVNRRGVIVGSCIRFTGWQSGVYWLSPSSEPVVLDEFEGYEVDYIADISLDGWFVCVGEKDDVTYSLLMYYLIAPGMAPSRSTSSASLWGGIKTQ